MPANYRLAPDSPLHRTDTPERIFSDPGQYAFRLRAKDMRELGFGLDKIWNADFNADILSKPVHSVLTHEEIDELLTQREQYGF